MEGGVAEVLQRVQKDVVVSVVLMQNFIGQGGTFSQLVVIAHTLVYHVPIWSLTRTFQQRTGTLPKEEGGPIQIDDILYIIT